MPNYVQIRLARAPACVLALHVRRAPLPRTPGAQAPQETNRTPIQDPMRTYFSQRFLAWFSPFFGPHRRYRPHGSYGGLCLGTSLAALAGACTGGGGAAPSESMATSTPAPNLPGPAVALVTPQSNKGKERLRTDVSISLDLSQNFTVFEEEQITYTGSGLPPGLTLLPTGQLTGRAHEVLADDRISYNIRITATDQNGYRVTDSFKVTTSPTNSAPLFQPTLTLADDMVPAAAHEADACPRPERLFSREGFE